MQTVSDNMFVNPLELLEGKELLVIPPEKNSLLLIQKEKCH